MSRLNMDGLASSSARYATLESRSACSAVAAVLVDVDTERLELLVRIEPETGSLTVTLYGAGFEAIGRGSAVLTKLSSRTTRTTTTVALNGYDTGAECCRQLEVAVSLAWTVDRADPSSVDVVGTALVTDLDLGGLVRFRAVRSHPFNRLRVVLESGQLAPANSTAAQPPIPPVDETQLIST